MAPRRPFASVFSLVLFVAILFLGKACKRKALGAGSLIVSTVLGLDLFQLFGLGPNRPIPTRLSGCIKGTPKEHSFVPLQLANAKPWQGSSFFFAKLSGGWTDLPLYTQCPVFSWHIGRHHVAKCSHL